ncbi:hypothetical protein AMTRI_Chr01g137440 [Amborella trichopoda]|uniref:Uncharacterized protein n=1 Tax=Amborella trichopoda TaxID=13333 RepID=W1PX05_AMBTC|nr:uncharacterized protein LOC18440574 [Amborella trichopoda]ERN12356.1 hypothetical protein AMTR_s00025p00088060 [Amborella trichopoda]|eukprot:XP_011625691.1 uncharacterized protein LOC18440574 [Amborella trichopoda]
MDCFCFYGSVGAGLSTKIWNLTEKPIDLQIRVGSILKKAHTVKPGKYKKLGCKSIYRTTMATEDGSLYMCDETCRPYVWVHERGESTRMVKQQYISIEDLRDHSDIRVCRDHVKGIITVQKKPRLDFC